MIPCLNDVLPEITQRIDRSRAILLGLDFDGTLTPLCDRPEVVALPDPVRAVLARLSRLRRVTVMIVSGRSIEDLVGRIGLAGLVYAGNHGLEIKGAGLAFVEPTACTLVSRLEHLTEALADRVRHVPGVVLEAKGLSTSLHFRKVAPESRNDLTTAAFGIVSEDSQRFVVKSGHLVWEIRPRVSWHKGSAVSWVAERLADRAGRLLFLFGDDQTDEDAFASHPEAVTVKVGDRAAATKARYWLPDPESVLQFLVWFASYLVDWSRGS